MMSEELNYEELLQEFDEYVQDYINDNGYNSTHAKIAARDDFEYEMKDNDLVRAVIIMRFGELLLEEPYLLQVAPNNIHKQFNSINYEVLKSHLPYQQYQDLISRTQIVLEKIKKHPITPNNIARWFYHQLIEVIKNYYNNLSKNELNDNEIAKDILLKFHMAKFTAGEKINLYTTLAECLLQDNLTKTEKLQEAKAILQEFNPEWLGDSYTEEEKQHLFKRMNNLLERLDEIKI